MNHGLIICSLLALSAGWHQCSAAVPQFSISGGVYTNQISLAISTTSSGASIHFTLDGSEPTATSSVYTAEIRIVRPQVVRARCFQDGKPSGAVVGQTYIIGNPDLFEFNSNLPIVIINTFGQRLSHENKIAGSIRFIDAAKGRRASPSGAADFDGRAMINIRGTSSLQFPKHSFTFRTRDEAGNSLKVPILGFPADSDWVLYAPYPDKSLMRDVLAYDLSNQMGHYASRTRFVEVFLNDSTRKISRRDYVGLYVFEEKIKQAKDRVNIAKLGPDQNNEPEISGGYIFKKDHEDFGATGGFSTASGIHFFYVEPREDQITDRQKAWLSAFLNRFESVLSGPDFADPEHGYSAYIDPASFIDFQWIVEMSRNVDGYRLSNYLQKDRNGKVKMEPIWDWNLSFGNANYMEAWKTDGWYWKHVPDKDYPWFRRLFKDPEFRQKYIDRWAQLRTNQFSLPNILGRVDSYSRELSEAQERNFKRWPILGRQVWPNFYVGNSFEDEVRWMKKWIAERLAWIDGQLIPMPALSFQNGTTASEQLAKLKVSKGEIYYTLDGSDPRASGGKVSTTAKAYSGSFSIQAGDRLFARTHSTNRWSAPLIASMPSPGHTTNQHQ